MPATTHSHHILDTDIPIFRPIDGIFSERQLSEILYSLEKGEIPRKYSYFSGGVKKWATRSKGLKEQILIDTQLKQNTMFIGEYQMVSENLHLVLAALENYEKVNVVDVGCGTGYSVAPILSFLKDKKQLGKYIAVDIVDEMCDLAISNLKNIGILNGVITRKYIHDFEDGHFADFMINEKKDNTVNLFCFFGTTLGNLVDRHRALANIRDTMTLGDRLWIGNSLINNMDYIENLYNNIEINSSEYEFYLGHILYFFDIFGIEHRKFGKIKIRQSEDVGMLKYYYQVSKSFILEIPDKKDKKNQVLFQENSEIIVCRLKNYAEIDLLNELKEACFKIKMLNVSDDYRSAVVLVSV